MRRLAIKLGRAVLLVDRVLAEFAESIDELLQRHGFFY